MAIDTAAKRASVLNVGSFFPGRIPYLLQLDGSDLNDKNERGAVVHYYAGLDVDTPVLVTPSDWRTNRRPRRR